MRRSRYPPHGVRCIRRITATPHPPYILCIEDAGVALPDSVTLHPGYNSRTTQLSLHFRKQTMPQVIGIDHVQLAIPAGGETLARQFYGVTLGLMEIPKPPNLAA